MHIISLWCLPPFGLAAASQVFTKVLVPVLASRGIAVIGPGQCASMFGGSLGSDGQCRCYHTLSTEIQLDLELQKVCIDSVQALEVSELDSVQAKGFLLSNKTQRRLPAVQRLLSRKRPSCGFACRF